VVVAALLALLVAVGLLTASLFAVQGVALAWLSVAADLLAATLLVSALRRRRPGGQPPRIG
jgi:hypothetical protein